MVESSYILKASAAALAATLALALLAGLLVFHQITRRLTRLTAAMQAFERGAFQEPPVPFPGDREGDEIDRLGAVFNEMSRRMMDQLRELQTADALRRELVANISHDLRTPLASLQGYLETLQLKNGALEREERTRYLEAATKNAERLGKLVTALFELAKLEAMETPVRTEPFSLAELVQDVAQKFEIEAERRGVRLATDFATDLPFVSADISLIERVLENLLDNALHHTPTGGQIRVALRRSADGIRVEVNDSGRGIPARELPHIFDRFYRTKSTEQEEPGGAGLGLAIVKRILQLHGTRIEVASSAGVGSNFSFLLPVHAG
jgi:signal transduction histidine kinase